MEKARKIGIFWFNNDLRLHDNAGLMHAVSTVDELLCVYVIDWHWRASSYYASCSTNTHSRRFLFESLHDLDRNLNSLGQKLLVLEANAERALNELIQQCDPTQNSVQVFRSQHAGWYENKLWQRLYQALPQVQFHTADTHTLFDLDTLPFSLANLPTSFSKFKNALKHTKVLEPIASPSYLPKPPQVQYPPIAQPPDLAGQTQWHGGESSALDHMHGYFNTDKPAHYKEVRNALDGWDNSCKLSPWLANGCLSARGVIDVLHDYEKNITANNSTYWIYFELLWREYFQWYAHLHGRSLFAFSGIKDVKPLTSYYAERLQKWINGSTPYPIVNACMNELRATGFLSNRGRQIVASCFVNELSLDWRYGAAYFEQALIDYDVAANWGNWQYLAGVGADTREKRHFNLAKQTQMFDPQGRYIQLWNGISELDTLDSVDAADWPT